MPLIIQKYGGKSVAEAEDILQVARLIHDRVKSGTQVVVVVSAMGDTTDRYLSMARAVNPKPAGRELDVLLSVGERISIAMLALALNGIEREIAVSLTGAQAGIITDTVHTSAKIVEIRPQRVREVLDQGRIPVIAGYQGITTDKNISTLGRGGTDATAVGLAVALGAERVEFMKDVDGIQTADPKLIPTARVLEQVGYEEALEMMGCGAKILQATAVELAAEHKIPLTVGNSKTGVAGTIITEQPLARRTLTAVHVAENVDCFGELSPEQYHLLLDSVRDHGLSPLLSFRQGERGFIALRSGEAELLDNSLFPTALPESSALVTLIGPGVSGGNELARAIRDLLHTFEDDIFAMTITDTRISVLIHSSRSHDFAARAHEFCLTASGAREAPR